MFLPISANLDVLDVNYQLLKKRVFSMVFLIGDHKGESVVPIVIKSGKEYPSHSALPTLTGNADYNIRNAYVFTTSKDVKVKGHVIYAPIYYAMFL